MADEPEFDVVAGLVRILKEGTPADRRRAAFSLGKLGQEAAAAAEALCSTLRGDDLLLRAAASDALAGLGTPAVVPLIAALQQQDTDFRKAVFITLGKIGPDAAAAAPILTVALEDEFLGPTAAEALTRINTPRRGALSRAGQGLRSWVLWAVVVGAILAVGVLVNLWSGGQPFPTHRVAHLVAVAFAILGAGVGGMVGASRWGGRGAFIGVAAFGLSGVLVGLALGALAGTAIEPLIRALEP